MNNNTNKFFLTITGQIILAVVFLGIGFFGGTEYKAYQIRTAIGGVFAPVKESLDDARIKGADASIKSQISSLRAEAEIFYDIDNFYTGLCDYSKIISTFKSVKDIGSKTSSCNVSSDGKDYAIATSLKSNSNNYYCVDSSGQALIIMNPLNSEITCK